MGLNGRQDTRKISDGQFTPSNYTPTPVGNEATNKVSAHLKGIDVKLGTVSGSVTNLWGMRNAIINGDMRIAQQGTSFAAIVNGAYSIDRWKYGKVGTMVHTISQVNKTAASANTPSEQFEHALKLDCTTADASIAAGDLVLLQQNIEGNNFRKFVGQTATLSFWIKAGKTGTMCVSFRNTGGDRSYVSEVTINSANTWEKKTVTLNFDYSGGTWNYTTGIGLQICFTLAAGSTWQTTADAWQNGNFIATSNQTNFVDVTGTTTDMYITGVQLELGSVATEFEFLDFGTELILCQRYYYKTYDQGENPGTNTFNGMVGIKSDGNQKSLLTHTYPVSMRIKPTIVMYGKDGTVGKVTDGNGTNVNAVLTHGNQNHQVLGNTVDIGINKSVYSHITANAEL